MVEHFSLRPWVKSLSLQGKNEFKNRSLQIKLCQGHSRLCYALNPITLSSKEKKKGSDGGGGSMCL